MIIGGSDAGVSAGLRAREVDPSLAVTLVVSDHYPNFSICGLPFYISGETQDWRSLAHRPVESLKAAGLELILDTTAESIDHVEKTVMVRGPGAETRPLAYDRLIVATGAEPIRPRIEGLELDGVHVLHTMDDSFGVRQAVESGARSAVIVGGGYLGLEMADAFRHLEIKTTVVEMTDQVMTSVDGELAETIDGELRSNEVELVLKTAIEGIEQTGRGLLVRGKSGFAQVADLVLVVVGVMPNAELAARAGVALGQRGAIRVTQRMETNVEGVYAAGDCVETHHRLLKQPTYLPLGTTAHKQGRVAGENAAGGSSEFAGSLGTQVVKVFDLAVARTGLRNKDGLAAGYDPMTVGVAAPDHKTYYPGASELSIRVTGDRRTGQLLGAQIVGDYRGQVAKRIDVFASAIFNRMAVRDLLDLDLSYTPPFASPWDPVQQAAEAWVGNRMGVTAVSRIRGTRGTQEDTEGHDDLLD